MLYYYLLQDANTDKNNSSIWNYPTTSPKTTWTGTGTATDPYLISTAQQLADLAYLMCEEGQYYNNYFALTNDIDLNAGITVDANTTDAKQWIAIGSRYKSKSQPFKGTFDGRGHKITGLYIKNPGSHHRSGLFGLVEGGTIKNLVLGQGYVEHNNYSAGAIVSMLDNGGEIIGCGNEGTQVVNTGGSAGGLVGSYANYGSPLSYIIDSYNKAKVTGSSSAGGIAGSAKTAQFYNCYNTGVISGANAGGIAGSASTANFYNCYNSGSIEGKSKSAGIANTSKIESSKSEGRITISNCYNIGLIKSGTYKGGISNEAYNKTDKEKVLLYCYYETSSANAFDGNGSLPYEDASYNGTFDSPTSTITTTSGYTGTLLECLNAFVAASSLKGLQTWKTGNEGYPVFTEDDHSLPNISVESDDIPVTSNDDDDDDYNVDPNPGKPQYKFKCSRCNGNGRCSNCGAHAGSGLCSSCNGSGTDFNGFMAKCGKCGGTGNCKTCNGTGKCPSCNGTGEAH